MGDVLEFVSGIALVGSNWTTGPTTAYMGGKWSAGHGAHELTNYWTPRTPLRRAGRPEHASV